MKIIGSFIYRYSEYYFKLNKMEQNDHNYLKSPKLVIKNTKLKTATNKVDLVFPLKTYP